MFSSDGGQGHATVKERECENAKRRPSILTLCNILNASTGCDLGKERPSFFAVLQLPQMYVVLCRSCLPWLCNWQRGKESMGRKGRERVTKENNECSLCTVKGNEQ